jgi:hypothetical protein
VRKYLRANFLSRFIGRSRGLNFSEEVVGSPEHKSARFESSGHRQRAALAALAGDLLLRSDARETLLARSRADLDAYDETIETYRLMGLFTP